MGLRLKADLGDSFMFLSGCMLVCVKDFGWFGGLKADLDDSVTFEAVLVEALIRAILVEALIRAMMTAWEDFGCF